MQSHQLLLLLLYLLCALAQVLDLALVVKGRPSDPVALEVLGSKN